MFDPSVSGYAFSSGNSPIPTKGVIVEVKTEEDWTQKVMIAPIRMARYPDR